MEKENEPLKEKERARKEPIITSDNILRLVALLIMPFLLLFYFYFIFVISKPWAISPDIEKRVAAIEQKMKILDDISIEMRKILEDNPDNSRTLIMLDLDSKVKTINDKLALYDQLFFENNPEQIVAIPILLKDIEIMKEEDVKLHNEIYSLSNLNKWFIGILMTLSIAVIGSLLSIFRKK